MKAYAAVNIRRGFEIVQYFIFTRLSKEENEEDRVKLDIDLRDGNSI